MPARNIADLRSLETFWAQFRPFLSSAAASRGDGLLAEMSPERDETEESARLRLLRALTGGEKILPLAGGDLAFLSFEDTLVQIEEVLIRQQYDFDTGNEAPFILDGGACFGLATYWMKQIYPKARILAFEPNPVAADVFRKNMDRLGVLDRNGFHHMISRSNSWPPKHPLMGGASPMGQNASLNLWAKRQPGPSE